MDLTTSGLPQTPQFQSLRLILELMCCYVTSAWILEGSQAKAISCMSSDHCFNAPASASASSYLAEILFNRLGNCLTEHSTPWRVHLRRLPSSPSPSLRLTDQSASTCRSSSIFGLRLLSADGPWYDHQRIGQPGILRTCGRRFTMSSRPASPQKRLWGQRRQLPPHIEKAWSKAPLSFHIS